MLDVSSLMLFMAATLALNLAPGPDMLYVTTRSLAQGTRAGVVSALGIAAGSLVHTLLVAFGFAALLRTVPFAYDAVRLAGAAYLVWFGIQALRAKSAATVRAANAAPAREWAMFRQGMITNLLNPKVALFFVAFLPQFASETRGSIVLQILVLGCLFNASGTAVNVSVAYLAGSSRRFFDNARTERLFRWLTASVFIGLGLRLALDDRRS